MNISASVGLESKAADGINGIVKVRLGLMATWEFTVDKTGKPIDASRELLHSWTGKYAEFGFFLLVISSFVLYSVFETIILSLFYYYCIEFQRTRISIASSSPLFALQQTLFCSGLFIFHVSYLITNTYRKVK